MRHTELSLRRPVTVTMIFAALALIGLISARLLPLEEFPDIEWPGFFVQIPYPGSTPEEVERLITRPAEEALATLPGVKRMVSTSSENEAQIWMQYGFNSSATTEAVEARVKLDAIRDQLPADVERINVFSGSLNDEPIVQLRISSERDLSDAYLMLDRVVKRRLERLEGVSKVELQGVEPPEVRILLDAGRVTAHGIDLAALAELLKKSNFAVSAGQITDAAERWTLRPNGEFASIEEIGELVIDTATASASGLRLADVAEIELRPRERRYGRHLDGRYAVGIAVSKATGANMVEVADRIYAEVDEIGELPEMRGISIFDLDNKANSVRKSLTDLVKAGVIGMFLAILVLYFFLRQASTTLLVAMTVPLSLLITLAALYFAGLSLNILTLMGMMLAVGMLVDNAVVITESIFRYRQRDPDSPERATLMGVREVGLAVIASTATSVCVFLPIVFGEQIDIMVFLWHVGVTICVAIVASLLIAQTLIPVLTARIAAPPPASAGFMQGLAARYTRALALVLAHPRWAALAALVVVASPALPLASGMLDVDMFPQEASRRLFLNYHIDGSHPLPRVERAVDRIEAYLFANRDELDIETVYSYFDEGRAESTILLTDESEASIGARDVMERILGELPEITIGEPSFKWEHQGGGEGFSVVLAGDSTERLAGLVPGVMRLLGAVEGLENLRSDLAAGEREIRITVDRERAGRFGLTSAAVAQAVQIAMRGENLREFRTPLGEIGMRLAFRDSDRQTLAQLADLRLATPGGQSVLLGTVAAFEEVAGPRQIRRTDRRTSVEIEGAIGRDATLEEVKAQARRRLDQLQLPTGYEWSFGRGIEQDDETQTVLVTNILLGVLLIFIVMAALFESALYPVSIMVSLVYSIVGVIWFLALTGTTLSFMAMIGIMILIGVVVNNGIVLVDHINNLRAEGLPRGQAVIEGARDRLRPILMTVCTTILGLAPLAVGTTQIGSGGPPYFPMARSIIGGLAFSTVTSLFLVPLVYVSLDRLRNWLARVRRLGRGEVGAAGAARA